MDIEEVNIIVNDIKAAIRKREEEEEEEDKPIQKKEDLFSEREYPWEDVLDSMKKNPESVRYINDKSQERERFFVPLEYTNEKCPKCGHPIIELYFCSPDSTWEHLCGRAGYMHICPHCVSQINFFCTMMN